MKFSKRLVQTLLSIDQNFNTVIGSGWADETLSAWSYRTHHWSEKWINRLFGWQKDHCRLSYESEQKRQQLPPEYRIIKEFNMAQVVNLSVDQGTTFRRNLIFTNPDGTPTDLTGCSFVGQFRTSYTATTKSGDFVFTDQGGGVVLMELPAATSSAVTATTYVYDLELTDAASEVSRVFQGKLKLNPEATK